MGGCKLVLVVSFSSAVDDISVFEFKQPLLKSCFGWVDVAATAAEETFFGDDVVFEETKDIILPATTTFG